MKVTIKETKKEVELLHYGFDLVIIQHPSGLQEAMTPREVGLKHRKRYKYKTGSYERNVRNTSRY